MAALGAGGDGHPRALAVDHRHLDGAAERGRGHGDRRLAEEVRAVALEEGVRLDRDEDVEVARRAAAHARLALAGETDRRAVLDARGDLDRKGLVALDAALAVAGVAGVLDHLTLAAAARAGPLDGEETGLGAHAPAPAAGRAAYRAGARLRARSVAGLAADGGGNVDLGLLALEGLFQGDL